ncbi:MAG: EAL domain-containing protein, partial [Granulosicoccaceae bacterium]
LDPELLEVEITEAIAVQNMQVAIDALGQLSDAGFSVSIDDFGTGYASLSYLQSLPIHKIKIDRSFIDGVLINPNDAAIVSAVIAMGHTLGLEVIAEGVESTEQLHFLRDLQCDQIQGYLISRPVNRDQADQLLQRPLEVTGLILTDSGSSQHTSFSHTGQLLSVLNPVPK